MHRLRKGGRGFSLIELMIVVVILGVLAAIAIPVFSRYVKRGKISEAITMLQNIRLKQEMYFQSYGRYVAIAEWHPEEVGRNPVLWERDGIQAPVAWQILGVKPAGVSSYFQYRIGAGGVPSVEDVDPDGSTANNGLNTVRPWWFAQCRGDLDGDGTKSFFELTSQKEDVYQDEALALE